MRLGSHKEKIGESSWCVAAGVDVRLLTVSHGMRQPRAVFCGYFAVSRTSAVLPSHYLILSVLEYCIRLFSILITSDVFHLTGNIVDVKVVKCT